MREFQLITESEYNPFYVDGHKRRLDGHLIPFFGDMPVAAITAGDIDRYRAHRSETGLSRRSQHMLQKLKLEEGESAVLPEKLIKKPAHSTLHQEIVCLRQVMKTALRHQWISALPDMTKPYRKVAKISRRAWFSYTEYKQLYTATGKRAAKPLKARWAWASEQLHDFVLFMANTGLRPDEAARLQFRDVEIIQANRKGEEILLIDVRGKRGTAPAKSTPNAVVPFKRLATRLRPPILEGEDGVGFGRKSVRRGDNKDWVLPSPTDLVFPKTHRQMFNDILDELKLKFDRDGQVRTAYSLRHTYISMRLNEGADVYQIAKNCRTSVEMIQKHYAAHLANTLNDEIINVENRKARSNLARDLKRAASKAEQSAEKP